MRPGNVASSLNNLAKLYRTQGQFAEALPLYQRALSILELALGPDHSNVATVLESLAILLYNMEQIDVAVPLYQRALAIRARQSQSS